MDCENLILLVQERKHLWDQRESKYHMRNVQKKKLWNEVSVEMNEPGKFLFIIIIFIVNFLHLA